MGGWLCVAAGQALPGGLLAGVWCSCREWVLKSGMLIAMSVYTYLRLIVDHHGSPQLLLLRQKEVDFCIGPAEREGEGEAWRGSPGHFIMQTQSWWVCTELHSPFSLSFSPPSLPLYAPLSLSLSLCLFPPLSPSLSPPLSLSMPLSLSISLSLSPPLSLSMPPLSLSLPPLSLFLSLSLSFSLSLSLSSWSATSLGGTWCGCCRTWPESQRWSCCGRTCCTAPRPSALSSLVCLCVCMLVHLCRCVCNCAGACVIALGCV